MAPRARDTQKQFSRLIDDVGALRVENQNTNKFKYLLPNGTRGNSQQKLSASTLRAVQLQIPAISGCRYMCASAHYEFPQLLQNIVHEF